METREKIEIVDINQLTSYVNGSIEEFMYAKVKNDVIKLKSEKVKLAIQYEEINTMTLKI